MCVCVCVCVCVCNSTTHSILVVGGPLTPSTNFPSNPPSLSDGLYSKDGTCVPDCGSALVGENGKCVPPTPRQPVGKPWTLGSVSNVIFDVFYCF